MAKAETGVDNRYARILERIFDERYVEGAGEVDFSREDIVEAASALDIAVPKNLGDLVYSFRYRTELPKAIREKAPAGSVWVIRPAGRAKYRFSAVDPSSASISPSKQLAETKILDATPGIISRYALSDEQALLAILRYNRLVDLFAGVTCYSLQSHLRSTVSGLGQVETDEVYVGVDRRGAHYVFPVQAKGGRDSISVVQIEQDIELCKAKFEDAICRPIAAQFMADDLIALFEFEVTENGVRVTSERHYRLVEGDELSSSELGQYRIRAP
jgi:hypothetical protein